MWLSELLDRHLLWIRSSKPVAIGDIKTLQFSLRWFFNPTNWAQLFKDTARSFHQKTAIWIIGLFLIVSRRWACRKLKDIQFWSYSTVVDGVSKTVPISLADISMAIIVVVTTIIAGHNLPGLLEVILLNHLPMNPGARYAYSTVCQYTITAIGIINVFNTIGIKWANLQWLVAALSVGLGVGLQEIVTNFVCGYILTALTNGGQCCMN